MIQPPAKFILSLPDVENFVLKLPEVENFVNASGHGRDCGLIALEQHITGILRCSGLRKKRVTSKAHNLAR